MKIVFALIFIFADSRAGGVKVGEYEKRAQCIEQGEMLKDTGSWNLHSGYYRCVPVNATGQR